MYTFIKLLAIFVGLRIHVQADVLDNYIEVTTNPPESIGAIPKCGEGPQRGKFRCVPYFNCDPVTNTVTAYPEVDGSLINIPRSIDEPKCGHYLEVCCQINNATIINVEHGPTVNLEFEPICGVKPQGNESAFSGEIPWMVGLLNVSSKNNVPFCGGSLLTPVVVLSAAHCVERFQPHEIVVRVGEWDGETLGENSSYQEKNLSEIIIHEHYFPSTLYNDVAILILNSSLHNAENIGTICVPQDLEDIKKKDCIISGWGEMSNSVVTKRLKEIQSSKLERELCQELLRQKAGKEFLLHSSFICAITNSDHDICVGDGGSPLVCPDSSNRYFQIGIVSWSVDCSNNIPSVYVNVVQYGDWISFKLSELGYNSKPYTKNNN